MIQGVILYNNQERQEYKRVKERKEKRCYGGKYDWLKEYYGQTDEAICGEIKKMIKSKIVKKREEWGGRMKTCDWLKEHNGQSNL